MAPRSIRCVTRVAVTSVTVCVPLPSFPLKAETGAYAFGRAKHFNLQVRVEVLVGIKGLIAGIGCGQFIDSFRGSIDYGGAFDAHVARHARDTAMPQAV